MYCLVSEKPPRFAPQGHFLRGVYGTFYLAIGDNFYESINIRRILKLKYSKDIVHYLAMFEIYAYNNKMLLVLSLSRYFYSIYYLISSIKIAFKNYVFIRRIDNQQRNGQGADLP